MLEVLVDDALEEEVDDVLDESELLLVDSLLVLLDVALEEVDDPDPRVALGGFTPLLSGPDKVRWVTSFHNWIKTWYAPLLFRPHLFRRRLHLLRHRLQRDCSRPARP